MSREYRRYYNSEATPKLVKARADLYSCLLDTFLKAVDAFNLRCWKDLDSRLAENVVLNAVTNPGIVVGKPAVIAYLEGQAADYPQFLPNSPNVDASQLTVSGTATWVDHDNPGGTTNLPINYKFTFEYDADSNTCQIINLYATPD